MTTIERKFKFKCGRRARKVRQATAPRVPRVARLMALAIRFDQIIRDGIVADQAELARLGHVSRARVTQIMDLLCLAPDIQEAIVYLPSTESGRDEITERQLRSVMREADWERQRQIWSSLSTKK